MFSYEGGLYVALLLWLWRSIMLIVSVNSLFERNLNKIGQRLSWTTHSAKQMSGNNKSGSILRKTSKYLLIIGLDLLFAFLSWASVACSICAFIYRFWKDYGTPQAVKEFRWKMRNVDMTFDQIIKELMKMDDEDLSKFAEYREQMIQEMEYLNLAGESHKNG